jgi:hypothetical protein
MRFEALPVELAETRTNFSIIQNNCVRFEVLAVVAMKSIVIWDVISCSLEKM